MANLEPPHNIEAEQALLGAIFLNNEAYHLVSRFLRPEHFYEPVNGKIYEECARTISAGRVANPVTLKDKFPGGLTDDVTASQYLAMLAAEATTILNAPDYATAIFENFQCRELAEIGTAIIEEAQNPDISPKDIIEEGEKAFFSLAESRKDRKGVQSFSHALAAAMDMLGAAYKRNGGLSGVPTGLSELDRLMGGLQRSDLIILAARPGMGKTSMATNIAFNLAKAGTKVGFFSLEMSEEQLATRVLSAETGVSSSQMRRGEFNEQEFNLIADTRNNIEASPLSIDDNGGQNIGQIISTARRLKRQRGLDLIVVDYIQLLSGTTKRSGENRVQEITEISSKLKGLAKELDVPVLALSQLSRQVENRDDKRPKLSDLRDSGSIEQDADVVLFIYREEYYLKNSEPKEGSDKHLTWQSDMKAIHGVAEIIISKQRHGPTGKIKVHFDDNLTKFSNLARKEYSPGAFE